MSDPTRFTDWDINTVEIQQAQSPSSPPPDPNAAVVYEADKVTAYFDAEGKSVPPRSATWAKVWTPDGSGGTTLEVVALTQPGNLDTMRAVEGV